MAIYRVAENFSSGGPRTKPASGQTERDSNPGPPDCESDALTNRLRRLLKLKLFTVL